jgi:hypothetical protein
MYIHTQVKLKSVHDVKSLAWMTREKLQVNKVHFLYTDKNHAIPIKFIQSPKCQISLK